MKREPLHIRYDRLSDVLYVETPRFGPVVGTEGAPGLIWEYLDDDGSLVGLTVMDYHAYWMPRLPQLVNEMSRHFHVPANKARELLEAANG